MSKKKNKNLTQVTGNLPAENKKEFAEIVGGVINQWSLEEPVDIMMANRMVSCWMRMRYIEGRIQYYGLFFEDADESGKIVRIRVNELVYLNKQLESEFRSYYRLLNNNKNPEQNQKQDFESWINAPKK